jgi:hypothetical protein
MDGAADKIDTASSPIFASFLKESIETTAAATVDDALSAAAAHLDWSR